jgi:von Willebrand factor type A domain
MFVRRACLPSLTWVFLAGCADASSPVTQETTDTGGIDVTASAESGPKLDMGVATTVSPTDPTALEAGSEGCNEVMVSVEPVIPTIVLLVDQSGSMTEDFSGQTRWDALYDTLMGPTGSVITLQSDVRFGLTLYSSTDGFEGGQCPQLTEVGPALDNFAAMDAVYAPADPIDETPTGESLALVATALAAFAEPGPKAIVLATDGEPDTCEVPNPQQGQPESIAAVQAAFDAGVSTFVISVGNEVGEAHLQEVANAGVGKAVDDANPAPFYVALDAGDLVDAFGEIIGGFISCEIPIDGIVELPQACDGTLLLDGVELTCPDDWHMLDESTIELLGEACATWKDGQPHGVAATWPCGAVSIP